MKFILLLERVFLLTFWQSDIFASRMCSILSGRAVKILTSFFDRYASIQIGWRHITHRFSRNVETFARIPELTLSFVRYLFECFASTAVFSHTKKHTQINWISLLCWHATNRTRMHLHRIEFVRFAPHFCWLLFRWLCHCCRSPLTDRRAVHKQSTHPFINSLIQRNHVDRNLRAQYIPFVSRPNDPSPFCRVSFRFFSASKI